MSKTKINRFRKPEQQIVELKKKKLSFHLKKFCSSVVENPVRPNALDSGDQLSQTPNDISVSAEMELTNRRETKRLRVI
jgi:RecB family exonuclease